MTTDLMMAQNRFQEVKSLIINKSTGRRKRKNLRVNWVQRIWEFILQELTETAYLEPSHTKLMETKSFIEWSDKNVWTTSSMKKITLKIS